VEAADRNEPNGTGAIESTCKKSSTASNDRGSFGRKQVTTRAYA